jgi:hypothetical protein
MKKVLNTNGQWNMVFFVIVVFAGAFFMVNLTFPVVALAYYHEIKVAAEKEDKIDNETVFDAETLKAQMADKLKELAEYERLHPKVKREEGDNVSEESGEVVPDEGVWSRLTDGQFQDDSEVANVSAIKLSENLGGFNDVIREGLPVARKKNVYFFYFII